MARAGDREDSSATVPRLGQRPGAPHSAQGERPPAARGPALRGWRTRGPGAPRGCGSRSPPRRVQRSPGGWGGRGCPRCWNPWPEPTPAAARDARKRGDTRGQKNTLPPPREAPGERRAVRGSRGGTAPPPPLAGASRCLLPAGGAARSRDPPAAAGSSGSAAPRPPRPPRPAAAPPPPGRGRGPARKSRCGPRRPRGAAALRALPRLCLPERGPARAGLGRGCPGAGAHPRPRAAVRERRPAGAAAAGLRGVRAGSEVVVKQLLLNFGQYLMTWEADKMGNKIFMISIKTGTRSIGKMKNCTARRKGAENSHLEYFNLWQVFLWNKMDVGGKQHS